MPPMLRARRIVKVSNTYSTTRKGSFRAKEKYTLAQQLDQDGWAEDIDEQEAFRAMREHMLRTRRSSFDVDAYLTRWDLVP